MNKAKIKVLVIDDAVLARKVIGDVISEERDMEMFAAAPNGQVALQRLAAGHPDVIVLDFEMPEMNGLETIDAIRRISPDIPIVMFSTLTERGARETFDALARGANDYVTKPSGHRGLSEAKQQIRSELVPKLRALTEPQAASETVNSKGTRPLVTDPIPNVTIEAIAIGVSTGGPNALSELIPKLPATLSVPVLITQHMPPTFTRMLAERLGQQSKLKVKEAEDGERIEAGRVYIAPGGRHLTLSRSGVDIKVALSDAPAENSCRPAVDVMLRSMVEIYDKHVLALILTGMGQDGLLGCQKVYSAGGIVLAQDASSSVVWGMPGAVAKAGICHMVLPLSELPRAVVGLASPDDLPVGKQQKKENSHGT